LRKLVLLLAILTIVAVAILVLSADEAIVVDDASLLNESERDFISKYHGFLVDDYDIDYRVVTTSANLSILEQSVDLFERLGVGSRSEWSRGLLLVINPSTDQVRLEVGFALEGSFPDAFIAYVEQRQMVPFFADGRVADGILAATELIVDRAQRQEVSSEEIWIEGSGGGGAQTTARVAAGRDTTQQHFVGESQSADSPAQALELYLRAMERRDASPDLLIYSPSTQAFLKDRLVTPAQMDGIVRAYRGCSAEPVRYSASAMYAVIRYPPKDRLCAPWFFVKSGSVWTLDLAAMSRAVRFGRSNAWHVSGKGFGDYAFGFDDWAFDEKGFPR